MQLRPTVRPTGKALEFDRSLFERLYTGPDFPRLARTMLDVSALGCIPPPPPPLPSLAPSLLTPLTPARPPQVQYRFPAALARFPSEAFYEGRLQTGVPDSAAAAAALRASAFPWPADGARAHPVVFVPCAAEEDAGRASKSNAGQAALVRHVLALLRAPRTPADAERVRGTSLAVLTPYARQAELLRHGLPPDAGSGSGAGGGAVAVASTIDGFQGREADVVVLATVRSNAAGELGFVDDARRLNVAWTRARRGLVVVGDRRTLEAGSALWRRALAACVEVVVACPEPEGGLGAAR